MTQRATAGLATALRRGAPPSSDVARAILAGTAAQLAGVALVGGAGALLTWSATRPGLGAVAGLLVAVELVAFLRAPLRHAERVEAHDLGLDGLRGWRTWLLEGVASWAPSRLAAARAGDLLSRCLDDADRLQELWVRILVPAASALVALVVAACLLALASPLAGAAVALATLLVAAATWIASSHVARLGIAESGLRAQVAARVVEFAHGAEALSLLRGDAEHISTTAALVHRADHLAARRGAVASGLAAFGALCAAAAMLVAIAAVPLPTAHPARSVGVVLAVLACGELLFGIPGTLEALGPTAGAAARIAGLAEPPSAGTVPAPGAPLALTHVDVAPASDEPVLLRDVGLEVRAGDAVSVSGPSGSGKSTLLAVAAALEPARGGTVTLGGVDVTECDEATLRRRVGWMPSHPGLLEGRVRDVVDVGRGLDDEALRSALDRAGLSRALEGRGGLEAVIGERGADLSAGERQRLALARLLAGGPEVYVLDEPTSGLDDDAAAVVLDALRATGAAVLVAAHDERVVTWATASRVVRADRLD